jgi:alpha-tubulin suppressor-like RCC1 family protein
VNRHRFRGENTKHINSFGAYGEIRRMAYHLGTGQLLATQSGMAFTMAKKTKRRISIGLVSTAFTLFIAMMAFQNCAPGFQVDAEVLASEQAAAATPELDLSANAELTNATDVTLSFAVGGVSSNMVLKTTCQLNDLELKECPAKSITYSGLADGDYVFKVSVETPRGKTASESFLFRKDSTKPVLTMSSTPSVLTNQVNTSFVFTATDNLSGVSKVQCTLDALTASDCASPASLTALAAGAHTFKVQVTDKAGNKADLYSYAWTIDLTVPTVLISANPLPVTNQTSASLTFAGTGIVSYECDLDAAGFTSCASPKTYAGLASGNHTFRVRGTNAAGTVSSPASYSWMIDNAPPATPVITANVNTTTVLTSATFNFSSTDAGSGVASYQCSSDASAFANCSSPITRNGLTAGSHSLQVKATDNAGNVSAVGSFTWVIDLSPPVIAFTQTPQKLQGIGVSAFRFSLTDAQGVASARCYWTTSTETSTPIDCLGGTANFNLPVGGYVFYVQATDALGNSSMLSYAWDIDDGMGTIAKFKTIKGRWVHFCGVTMNDTVKCWGNGAYNDFINDSAVPVDQPGIANVLSLSVGGWQSCVMLAGGHFNCWGNSSYGLSGDHGLTGALQISAGEFHNCVLLAGGVVKCWGNNSSGQVGNGTTVDQLEPVDVQGLAGAKFVSAGNYGSCAITAQDTVKCWGAGFGNLPVAIAGLSNIKFVDAGGGESCAIDNQNNLKCWSAGLAPHAIVGLPQVKSIAVDNYSACAVGINGLSYCWGSNQYGGLSSKDPKATFAQVMGLTNVKEAAVGVETSCFLTEENTVKCTGGNDTGEIGYSVTSIAPTPVDFKGLSDVKMISGFGPYCALTNAGTVKCWGRGNLGNGTDDPSLVPVDVAGLSGIKSISVGDGYTCVITAQDTVKCWGRSGDTRAIVKVPTDVAGLTGVKSIQVGWQHACALAFNGVVKCWGSDPFNGALGNGATTQLDVPTEILSDVSTLAGTAYNYCAIVTGGAIKCWGYNFTTTPQAVPAFAGIKSISGGQQSFCGVDANGSIQCWNNAVLMAPQGLTGFSTVAAGYLHNCAMNAAGDVRCWGDNSVGELGYNYTAPAPYNTAVPMTTLKSVAAVFPGSNVTYLKYVDGTIGLVGPKSTEFWGLTAVIKDPQ